MAGKGGAPQDVRTLHNNNSSSDMQPLTPRFRCMRSQAHRRQETPPLGASTASSDSRHRSRNVERARRRRCRHAASCHAHHLDARRPGLCRHAGAVRAACMCSNMSGRDSRSMRTMSSCRAGLHSPTEQLHACSQTPAALLVPGAADAAPFHGRTGRAVSTASLDARAPPTCRKHTDTAHELLARRRTVQARFDAGQKPHFLPHTREVHVLLVSN